MLLSILGLQQTSVFGHSKNLRSYFLCCALIAKFSSKAENNLMVEPTGEEAIPKIVEYTKIITEENGIVIFASGFSQGGD